MDELPNELPTDAVSSKVSPPARSVRDARQVGAVLPVEIRRILPFGLIVRMPDGGEGLIRRREFTWESAVRQHNDAPFTVGQKVNATFLEERGHYVELSIRLAQHDPWLDIADRYWPGQWRNGLVTGVVNYGVFIQLEPGVSGLLHRSHLPNDANPIGQFWVGDQIMAAIEKVDVTRRRIGLTLAGLSDIRWRERDVNALAAASSDTQGRTEPSDLLLPLRLSTSQRPKKIVVIEDDPAQRQAVCAWLQNAGQIVLAYGDAESTCKDIDQINPDLFLTDLTLPGGMDGIEAIRQVRRQSSHLQCALMTDWANAFRRGQELDELQALEVSVLLKPLRPDDLIELIGAEQRDGQRNEPTVQHADFSSLVQLQTMPESPQVHAERLENELIRMRRQIRAAKVVLFELDPHARHISIVAEDGGTSIRDASLPELMHSPVRDVAEDRQTVVVQDVERVGQYAQKLYPIMDSGSCIGHPVTDGHGSALALFAFFAQSGQVSRTRREFVQAYSHTIGAILQEQQILTHVSDMQRVALMGYMAQMLVHEINHHLTPLSMSLGQLQSYCRSAENNLDKDAAQMRRDMQFASETLHQLGASVHGLIDKARLFGRMLVQDQASIHRIDRIIDRAIELVTDQAQNVAVRIEFQRPEKLLVTHLHATQIQQVLLNVMLNAVQQIARQRSKDGGMVSVRVEHVMTQTLPMLRILIEDDGPGIHRRLWQRVFDLGFSTRDGEGSGLGLYLSRQLLQDMGGEIRIADSRMLWGTTVEILLPVALSERRSVGG